MKVKLKIKELRIDKGLSQRQLADMLGVTEGNYRRLENNQLKQISFETIGFLCEFFNCTTEGIFELLSDNT